MTLKLPHASGNAVSITAPATNPAADRSLALPGNSNGTILTTKYPSGIQVLEQFFSPCDGSTIATAEGNITLSTVSATQALTTSYADITGSSIAYTPPTGATQVIYKYVFVQSAGDASNIGHYKLFVDSDEVTNFRKTIATHSNFTDSVPVVFTWGLNIGGSAVTATGRQASWSSAKTIKIQGREYNSDYDVNCHQLMYWDGASSTQFSQPSIGITAIG